MAARGVSQRAVYDRAGVPASTLGLYLKGRSLPTVETVERLAAFFGDDPTIVRGLVAEARSDDLDLNDPELSLMLKEVGRELTPDERESIKPFLRRAIERKRLRDETAQQGV